MYQVRHLHHPWDYSQAKHTVQKSKWNQQMKKSQSGGRAVKQSQRSTLEDACVRTTTGFTSSSPAALKGRRIITDL